MQRDTPDTREEVTPLQAGTIWPSSQLTVNGGQERRGQLAASGLVASPARLAFSRMAQQRHVPTADEVTVCVGSAQAEQYPQQFPRPRGSGIHLHKKESSVMSHEALCLTVSPQ